MNTQERLTSFSQVEIGDYCLVLENDSPILGKVFVIPEDKHCVYYQWRAADNTEYTRGIAHPENAFIVRASPRGLRLLIGKNYSTNLEDILPRKKRQFPKSHTLEGRDFEEGHPQNRG